jgi:hypothetical protein
LKNFPFLTYHEAWTRLIFFFCIKSSVSVIDVFFYHRLLLLTYLPILTYILTMFTKSHNKIIFAQHAKLLKSDFEIIHILYSRGVNTFDCHVTWTNNALANCSNYFEKTRNFCFHKENCLFKIML